MPRPPGSPDGSGLLAWGDRAYCQNAFGLSRLPGAAAASGGGPLDRAGELLDVVHPRIPGLALEERDGATVRVDPPVALPVVELGVGDHPLEPLRVAGAVPGPLDLAALGVEIEQLVAGRDIGLTGLAGRHR